MLGTAADVQTPEALLDVASGCMEDGEYEAAEAALETLATHPEVSSMQKFEACRKLAIHAEWKLKDFPRALLWTDTALELDFLTQDARQDLQKRKKRLEARSKGV